eukprot:TRINITY_DN10901_c0_g1_i1.p1 TRINITY_DN10901_c0_g1~~TRINITY_DN10901_c0_g1_i1.p1  ORF type:complete len:307 (+),score=63.53 TRINITY_DN10901_c0_g1_i1:292-1212(+)
MDSLWTALATPLGVCTTVAAGLLGYLLLRPKKQIGECCPGQSHGFLPQDDGYACKGTVQRIKSASAYVVGDGPKAVVLVHDIFGLHTGRLKQIADEIASSGFTVVAPDFFESCEGGLFGRRDLGYSTPRSMLSFLWAMITGSVKSYMREHPWDPACERIWTESVVPWLKERHCTSVGLVGFCWGAYVTVHAAARQADTDLPLAAHVMYHPSYAHVAALFGEDQEATVRAAAKVPTQVYSTSMEPKSWRPGGQAERWMRDAHPEGVVQWHQEKQMHGFMTRGNMKRSLSVAEDVQRCLKGGIAFLSS